jgi:hypothetical protein
MSNKDLSMAQFEFMKNCFFLFDDLSQDEMADSSDLILYFYPKEVSLNK